MTSTQLQRELERLEELAEALESRTDDLNDLIDAFSDRLEKAAVSVTAWIESKAVPGWYFGYCKVGDRWSLAARKGRGVAMVLTAAPRKLRLAAMSRSDELIKELADKSQTFLDDVEEATRITKASIGEELEDNADNH